MIKRAFKFFDTKDDSDEEFDLGTQEKLREYAMNPAKLFDDADLDGSGSLSLTEFSPERVRGFLQEAASELQLIHRVRVLKRLA